MNIEKLPKIELHLHLDGSVRISTAKDLLCATYDVGKYMVAPLKCESLDDYLSKFELPITIMQTKENLKRISSELAEDLEKDGVVYAEVRFAPMNHTQMGLSLEEVIDSVLQGFRKSKIKINVIVCLMRGEKIEKNKRVIDAALKYLDKGVCALDLAGSESRFPVTLYKDLFAYSKEKGIPFTIHAGEADGSLSIKNALAIGAFRIGHGIRVVEDPNLLDQIIRNKIPLEVCPISNVQTNVITEYKDHPIRFLFDRGVKVTINTDNRTVSNTTLTEEYERLIRVFHFTKEDLLRVNINAIEASFMKEEEKKAFSLYFQKMYH